MNSTQSGARLGMKPSGIKPPVRHGSHTSTSSIPKFSSTRSVGSVKNDAHKENESPARRERQLMTTKRVSPQKATYSPSSSTRSLKAIPPAVPDGKTLNSDSNESFQSSGVMSYSGSEYSRYDVGSVYSADTAVSRSTDGGNRSLGSKSSSTGAKVVRPPNTQSRFDVTQTKSLNSSLPRPPPARSSSSNSLKSTSSATLKTVGGQPLQSLHPAFEGVTTKITSRSKSASSSTHSSPSTKSVRSGTNSVGNSPARGLPKATTSVSSATKASPVSDQKRRLPVSSHSYSSTTASPARTLFPTEKEELTSQTLEEITAQLHVHHQVITDYLEKESQKIDYVPLLGSMEVNHDPLLQQLQQESFGKFSPIEFRKYCKGEDLMEEMVTEMGGTYDENVLMATEYPVLDQLLLEV